MREIDQVRITLLRMFRGAVRLPQEIIDEMLKAFLHTRNAAIRVQAYGRGTLARFRDHNMLFGTPFSTQVRVLHDNFMMSGSWRSHGNDHRAGFDGDSHLLHPYQWPGIEAIWATRASRRSRRALELDRGWWGRTIRDEPLALFRRWLRYTEKRMTWYDAHHRLQWTQASSPAYWRIMGAHGLSVAQIRNILAGSRLPPGYQQAPGERKGPTLKAILGY
eukprot:scaffold133274_cov104-Phaeocystis_antarctica.AAC.1